MRSTGAASRSPSSRTDPSASLAAAAPISTPYAVPSPTRFLTLLGYDAQPAITVWFDYLNYGFEIDRATAHLLLGAVLSDTDGLTGSTTTEADRKAVSELAGIAGVTDVGALYHSIHVEKLSFEGMTNDEIPFSDYREYEAGGTSFGIGLGNAIDEDSAKELADSMKDALPAGYDSKNMDLMYASVGIRENGKKIDHIIPANEHSKEVFEAASPTTTSMTARPSSSGPDWKGRPGSCQG